MAVEIQENQLAEALHTVAVNGSYNASRALSKWFKRGVRLTSDGFSSISVTDASSIIGTPDAPIAAIHLPLCGDLTGHMLLAFPKEVGLSLVDIMMQVPDGTAKEFGELEQSCLQETGNIVCSAYANSLSSWLGLHIEPAVPTFGYDMACAIVDPLLMEAVIDSDEVLVAMTDFQMDGQKMQWAMLLLPTGDSIAKMEERCKLDEVRRHALQTIAINGAFEASRAMSKWLKKGVKITTDGFTKVELVNLTCQFDEDQPVVAMHLPLADSVQGHTLLTIPLKHAKQLAGLLIGTTDESSEDLSELELSALAETSNVLVSAYLNSWSKWLDLQLEPASPEIIIDLPGPILQSVLAAQASTSDSVFMARTDFMVDDHWLELMFLLLPAPSAMRLIESACQ